MSVPPDPNNVCPVTWWRSWMRGRVRVEFIEQPPALCNEDFSGAKLQFNYKTCEFNLKLNTPSDHQPPPPPRTPIHCRPHVCVCVCVSGSAQCSQHIRQTIHSLQKRTALHLLTSTVCVPFERRRQFSEAIVPKTNTPARAISGAV